MPRVIYNTATSFNGFIADESNSLDWLFAVEAPEAAVHERFLSSIGVLVQGSTTYEWVLREENLLETPEKWPAYFGPRPTFVFTSRTLPVPEGADVRFVSGAVDTVFERLTEAAGDRDIWIVGGGDLAGQFFDSGHLDEIQISVAPAALTGGAPLFPRRVNPDALVLREAVQQGQFAQLIYEVRR
jgi:dihydrofolate reductase